MEVATNSTTTITNTTANVPTADDSTLRFVSYNELMYEMLSKHENCMWEKLVHCLHQSSVGAEQSTVLKNINKEKKKIIRMFTRLLEYSSDAKTPCENCVICQKRINLAEEKVKTVALNKPSEDDFKKQYQQFQEELLKHSRLQPSVCSTGNCSGMTFFDMPSVVMDTATTTMVTNDATLGKPDTAVTMEIPAFESIPKNEEIIV